jgi:hypothetical protein
VIQRVSIPTLRIAIGSPLARGTGCTRQDPVTGFLLYNIGQQAETKLKAPVLHNHRLQRRVFSLQSCCGCNM